MAAEQLAGANKKWGEMIREGNAKGLADLYAEDCTVLAPGVPAIAGRAALQKLVEGFIAGGIKDAELRTEMLDPTAESVPEGGLFWERGSYTFFKEGGVVMDTGKCLIIWKKVSGGKVQLYVDMWNSNKS